MCIFSGPVRSVSDTNIFARLSGRGTQFLVYSMKYASARPVAMILPLPVASPEKRLGIRFISLKDYPEFFDNIEAGFPRPQMDSRAGGSAAGSVAMSRPTIHVESVGDFIASYVPTLDDFDRLDRRFRLPRSVWNKIPAYRDYGFAVFQLKDTAAKRATASNVGDIEIGTGITRIVPNGRGRTAGGDNSDEYVGEFKVHPMAFEFHTRFPDTLYFPTVHVHDGHVHRTDSFDHSMYLQDPRMRPDGRTAKASGPIDSLATPKSDRRRTAAAVFPGEFEMEQTLRSTVRPAIGFVNCRKAQGIVDQNGPCFKFTLNGDLLNKDTLIRAG